MKVLEILKEREAELNAAIKPLHDEMGAVQRAIASINGTPKPKEKKPAKAKAHLAPREAEALKLIREGMTDKQGARKMKIAVPSFQVYRSILRRKGRIK